MVEGDPGDISRRIYRRFKLLDRRRSEAVREEFGSKAVAKLDRITERDLGLELRERWLAQLWGDTGASDKRHRVLVNLRQPDVRARSTADRNVSRRRAINAVRRAGLKALDRLRPDIKRAAKAEVLNTFWLTRSLLVRSDAAGVVEMASRSDVWSVAHDKPQIAVLLDASRPLIHADQVENTLGITGEDVTVAVLDTGVDFTHAALAPVAGGQFDFSGEGIGDLHGHGTHCAGVIASNDRRRRGVAPGVVLSDYKHLNSVGAGSASTAISAIQQSVTDGIDVTSNSWGFSHANGQWTCPDGQCVICTAANAAVDAGQVFVVAAGNDDNDSCSTFDTHIGCPGHATNAITVAASDKADAMAGFSSIGPAADGRPKPDITAPGVDIVSARASTGSDMGGQAPVVDAVWCQASGTSQATPHVAGVAALMLERNRRLSPQQIKDVMMKTAVNIGATADEMGAGRIDAFAAVSAV
jgi:serine protease AprX